MNRNYVFHVILIYAAICSEQSENFLTHALSYATLVIKLMSPAGRETVDEGQSRLLSKSLDS